MSDDPKIYITAQQLMQDSLELGRQVLESDFRPNFIVGVWRGGTPVGIAVQELLDFYGVETDHISIRTSSYHGMQDRDEKNAVRVHGMSYLTRQMNHDDSLLIVDDVFDTGLSVKAIIEYMEKRSRRNMPAEVRVATAYFKPERNRTDFKPDFCAHTTDEWLVFPHEMEGLTRDEIAKNKPELLAVMDSLGSKMKPAKMR